MIQTLGSCHSTGCLAYGAKARQRWSLDWSEAQLTFVVGYGDGGDICEDGQEAGKTSAESLADEDDGTHTTRSTRIVSFLMRMDSIKYVCRWTQSAILIESSALISNLATPTIELTGR